MEVKVPGKMSNGAFPYSVPDPERHEIVDWVTQTCYETSNSLLDGSVFHPSLVTSAVKAEEYVRMSQRQYNAETCTAEVFVAHQPMYSIKHLHLKNCKKLGKILC